MARERLYEIDVIKAACILAVVYIHSISSLMAARHEVGQFLGHFTRFAVPGLVFAAGFLFRKSDIGNRQLSVRLVLRIVPPYLVSSLVILYLGLSQTRPALPRMTLEDILYDLLTGNAVRIYYFVFVISYLYAFSFLLRLCRTEVIWGLWAGSVCAIIVFYINPFIFLHEYLFRLAPGGRGDFFFVVVRHPVIHLAYYLSGWVLSLGYDTVRPLLKERFKPVMATAAAADLAVLCAIALAAGFTDKQLLIQLHIVLMVLLLLLMGIKGFPRRGIVDFLSRNTYGIFLFHLPFVRGFQALFPRITRDFSAPHSIGAWCAGIAGSLLIIVVARRILGRYSFYVVGS